MNSLSVLCSRNVTTAGDFNQHPFYAFVLDSNRRALPQERPSPVQDTSRDSSLNISFEKAAIYNRSSKSRAFALLVTGIDPKTMSDSAALLLLFFVAILLRFAWNVVARKMLLPIATRAQLGNEKSFPLRRLKEEAIFFKRNNFKESKKTTAANSVERRAQRRRKVSFMVCFFLCLIVSSLCLSTAQALEEIPRQKGHRTVGTQRKYDSHGIERKGRKANDLRFLLESKAPEVKSGDARRQFPERPKWTDGLPTPATVVATIRAPMKGHEPSGSALTFEAKAARKTDTTKRNAPEPAAPAPLRRLRRDLLSSENYRTQSAGSCSEAVADASECSTAASDLGYTYSYSFFSTAYPEGVCCTIHQPCTSIQQVVAHAM